MLEESPRRRSVVRSQMELNTILAAHERYALYQGRPLRPAGARGSRGLNLANRKLMEADFSGASLFGANLSAPISSARACIARTCATATFSSRTWCERYLRGASFKDAGTLLRRARPGRPALDNDDLFHRERRCGTHASDDGRQERRVAVWRSLRRFLPLLAERRILRQRQTVGCEFHRCAAARREFRECPTDKRHITGAVLTGVNLRELIVPAGALDGCVLDVAPDAEAKVDLIAASHGSMRIGSGLRAMERRAYPPSSTARNLRPLRGMLRDDELTGLSARRTNCIGLDFSGSQLQAAKFDGADLRDADFFGCDLRGASFRGAKLAHAKFERAILKRLRLTNGTTLAPDFTGADHSRAAIFRCHPRRRSEYARSAGASTSLINPSCADKTLLCGLSKIWPIGHWNRWARGF